MHATIRRHLAGLLLAVLVGHGWLATAATDTQPQQPILILVSFDGWRWDYLERMQPPTLAQLARDGVRAEGLIPVFPSKTFPNHYSIVTGLTPARHGITSNNITDPALPDRFTLSVRRVQQDTRWWGGEPLWVTAERQGQRTATMFWPGSDVEIAGWRPTYWRTYQHELPDEARVDQLLEWLQQPEPRRPTFLTMYFSGVDDAGHAFGPQAPETRAAVLALDRILERLVAGVERLGLTSRTNFLLVSDHGMAALAADRVIMLDDYLDLSTVDVIDTAPIVGLVPRAGRATVESVYDALAGKHPALQVYTSATLPDVSGLRDHPRLPPIIGIADDGWHPTTRAASQHASLGGNHGYEPRHRSMHGLFVAAGPQFKQGLVVPAFANVHLYELMCRVLGLTPASNDGDADVTAGLLR